MKFTRSSILLLCILTTILLGCDILGPEDPEQLHAATQTGQRTFGCNVDGTVWNAKLEPFSIFGLPDHVIVNFDPQIDRSFGGHNLSIYAIHGPWNERIYIECDSVSGPGVYRIRDGFYRRNDRDHPIDTAAAPLLRVTHLDTAKRIVAGTFEFDCTVENGKKVKITEGRFDLLY